MALTHVPYEAPGWGAGAIWLAAGRLVHHEPPRPGGGRLPGPAGDGGGDPESARLGADLAERLAAYFAGEAPRFDDVALDSDGESPFTLRLTEALRRVPRASVVTYGELAARAGSPRAARAAGTFCARNRFAVVVPCHRVVAACGIGGYGDLGVAYKRRLLALEGRHGPL